MRRVLTFPAWLLGPVLLLSGCGKPSSTAPAPGGPAAASGEEKQVTAALNTLQLALQSRDPERIWPLLDTKTQQDAEAAARAWKKAYADADVTELSQTLGIGRGELEKLTGRNFAQTSVFYEKGIDTLAHSSKVDAIKVEGDQATVDYREPKGDAKSVTFHREGGKWKARLSMPMPKS